jgi:predicted TPR repeat methyltransferase
MAEHAARRGDDEAALGHYRQALALEPRRVEARVACAELPLRTGERDNARALLEAGRQLDADDESLRRALRQVQPEP